MMIPLLYLPHIAHLSPAPEVHRTTVVALNWLTAGAMVIAGAVGGAAAGFLAGRRRGPSNPTPEPAPEPVALDDAAIDYAAAAWAASHGRQGFEDLVAEKLRVLGRLQQERRRRFGWPR